MNLSKYTLAATLLLATASSSSASHVQCNTNGSGSCPRNKMAYVCEEGQNMCCTWSNLPDVRNQRMQRRVDEMTREIDLPKYGSCQRYTQSTNGNKNHDNINIPPPTPAELRQKRRACNRGGGDGLDAVMKVFKNNCNNALGRNFERKVNNNWTRRTGNTWLSNAYNECAEEAVEDELARIADQCEVQDDLLGTSWVATSIVKDGVVWPVLKTYPATLTFNKDGTYTASGGCLERSGKVEVSNSEFEFDNYEMSISMKCDDISVDGQERAFEEAVLDQESLQYSIDQQVLTLYDEDGQMMATFVPLTKSKVIKKHGPAERATGNLRVSYSTH